MKTFIGYYIIGASSKKEAEDEKGLLLWSNNKPNRLKRFFNKVLLGIHWVDKRKLFEERGKTVQSSANTEVKVEMRKLAPEKINKKTDGRPKPRVSTIEERGDSKRSS